MNIVGVIKKYLDKVSGAEREIIELEAREENARFDLRRLTTDKINVEKKRRRHLAVVLTGKICPLDKDALKFVGLNEEVVIEGRDKSGKIEQLTHENEMLNAKYFDYFTESVCEGVDTRKVPVVVYADNRVVYANKKFERKFGSAYGLGVELRKDGALMTALEKGEGHEVDFKRGILVFIEHDKKVGDVNVAYFLPGDSRMKERVKKFRKKNERAVMDIYDAIKRQGVAFA